MIAEFPDGRCELDQGLSKLHDAGSGLLFVAWEVVDCKEVMLDFNPVLQKESQEQGSDS